MTSTPDGRQSSQQKQPWEMTARDLLDPSNRQEFSKGYAEVDAARVPAQQAGDKVLPELQTAMTQNWLAAWRMDPASMVAEPGPRNTSHVANLSSPGASGTATSSATSPPSTTGQGSKSPARQQKA